MINMSYGVNLNNGKINGEKGEEIREPGRLTNHTRELYMYKQIKSV